MTACPEDEQAAGMLIPWVAHEGEFEAGSGRPFILRDQLGTFKLSRFQWGHDPL